MGCQIPLGNSQNDDRFKKRFIVEVLNSETCIYHHAQFAKGRKEGMGNGQKGVRGRSKRKERID